MSVFLKCVGSLLPDLDGKGVQVVEHHMVWFRQQGWVTLLKGDVGTS